MTTRINGTDCPYCGKGCDAVTGVNNEGTASPGDVSICWYCGEVALFGAELDLRKPTPQELIDMQVHPTWPVIERHAMEIKGRANRA